MVGRRVVVLVILAVLGFVSCEVQYDYKTALTNSLLYLELQRSGKLPPDHQRVSWRGDSALHDGSDHGVDLTGGYYDAGDNMKFGFPMALTVTLLSWSVVEYKGRLAAHGELGHALAAVRWGADYLARAHTAPEKLFVQVGNGDSDHACWERPEDMDTPRTAYKIDVANPGSDAAAETAAALAAASLAFAGSDGRFSSMVLTHAKQLFDFAKKHRGLYQNSVPAGKFYGSSNDEDELLWAATWLFVATGGEEYKAYIGNANSGGVRAVFNWDDKYAGAQTLVAKLILEGKLPNDGNYGGMKSNLEQFLCNVVQRGSNNVKLSPGGGLWWQPWNNLQYTTAAMLLLSAHSDHLSAAGSSLQCGGASLSPSQLISFVQSQVNYILGENPKKMSYMVGYGRFYPGYVHHRGSSVPSIKANPGKVTCMGGYDFFRKSTTNPNMLIGAIVGGPDANDQYNDSRSNYQQTEPTTVTVAPIVGVLARLA